MTGFFDLCLVFLLTFLGAEAVAVLGILFPDGVWLFRLVNFFVRLVWLVGATERTLLDCLFCCFLAFCGSRTKAAGSERIRDLRFFPRPLCALVALFWSSPKAAVGFLCFCFLVLLDGDPVGACVGGCNCDVVGATAEEEEKEIPSVTSIRFVERRTETTKMAVQLIFAFFLAMILSSIL